MTSIIIPFYFSSYYLAAYNRFACYAKELIHFNASVKFVVFYSNDVPPLLDMGSGEVIFIKCCGSRNKLIREVLIIKKIWHTLNQLACENDIVLMCQTYIFVLRRLESKGCKVIIEITEHPDVGKGVRRSLQRIFINNILQKAAGLFVITHSLYNYFIKQGIKGEKICIVNMFVDTSRFDHNNESQNIISYCGSISISKDGVDYLLRAFGRVLQRYPDYRLMLIGRFISEHDEKEIERIISDLGLNDSVVLTGRVNPEEMVTLLQQSEILALARPNNKQAAYGFPTKLGEYLASGRPAVITHVGELDCFLKDKWNCLMVEPNDDNSFAEALIWAIEHPKEAAVIGSRGKELANTSFSSKIQVKVAYDFMQKKCDC